MSDFFDPSEIPNYVHNKHSVSEEYLDSLEEDEYVGAHSKREMGGAVDKKRFFYLKILVVFCLGFLSLRLFHLQILTGSLYRTDAEENRLRTNSVIAPRGLILDSKNQVLARNIASWQLAMVPADFFRLNPNYEDQVKTLEFVGLGSEVIQAVKQEGLENSFLTVLLGKDLTREEFLRLAPKIRKAPGLGISEFPIREYPYKEKTSHVLGYLGKINQEEYEEKREQGYLFNDYLGKEGVEYFYEEGLRGEPGQQVVEVDAVGEPQKVITRSSPLPGNNLILTIDAGLQEKLYDRLQEQMNTAGTTKAAAVIMDPRDGSIRALVNLPAFDNNLFSRGISTEDYSALINNPDRPLFNRSIAGAFPPGSSLKPFIGAVALEEGVIPASQKINCYGGLVYHGYGGSTWVFPDPYVHGLIDIKKAIAVSCNTFFYVLGGGHPDYAIDGIGITKIGDYATKFGFGQETGVDLPGEAAGLVPSIAWKEEVKGERWYIGDTYHVSIGQGDFTTTPLQLAAYMSLIASGKLYRPHLLDHIDKIDGNTVYYNPVIVEDEVISESNLDIIRAGMRQTITEGSGRRLNDLPVTSAGKTGTAQCSGCGDKTHSWFVSFAPYENPELAMVVLLEEAGGGHEHAVPVTRDVLEWYFSQNNDN